METRETKNLVFNSSYYQYEAIVQQTIQDNTKYNEFKERISQFKKIKTLEEALALSKRILPVTNEINRFNIGNAKCIVVNRKDCFRITLESEREFIAYNFV